MIKAIQVGLAALRFIAPIMAEAESVFGKGTGANKLVYLLRKIKLAFALGSELNAIGEGDAAGAIEKIDTVFTPAINEVVAINNEFNLWDGFVKLWTGVASLFGGDEPAPAPSASVGEGDVPEMP